MRSFLILIALTLASPSTAQSLLGREVTFQVLTYDDPAELLYESPVFPLTVTDGPEIGLEREGRKDGFNVVPIILDFDADTLLIDYSTSEPSEFYKTKFNGYVIDFGADCPRVAAAQMISDQTTMEISGKRIQVENGVLRVNVSGLSADQSDKMMLQLSLESC